MVHSPTDDLFNTQQWEHWAMVFILVLGLFVGYGQAAAEDRRRAQRQRGGPRGKSLASPRRSRRQSLAPAQRRRPSGQEAAAQKAAPQNRAPQNRAPQNRSPQNRSPQNTTAIAPKFQR